MVIPPSNVTAQAAAQAAAASARPTPPLRQTARTPGGPKREEDEVIMGPEAVDRAQRVRGLADNSQEEAREDRQEQAPPEGGERKPGLDVAG